MFARKRARYLKKLRQSSFGTWFVSRWQSKRFRLVVIIVAGLGLVSLLTAIILVLSGRLEAAYLKGALVLNRDKSSYRVNETVLFFLSAVDADGKTPCDLNVELAISPPKTWRKTYLRSSSGQIQTLNQCESSNDSQEPNAIARYTVTKPGKYTVSLKNIKTGKKVKMKLVVTEEPEPITIVRAGAQRLNPWLNQRFAMEVQITAMEDFEGEIEEHVPAAFTIIWHGEARVSQITSESQPMKTITWSVKLNAGESRTLAYDYGIPRNSPAIYSVGPVVVERSTEAASISIPNSWHLLVHHDE